MVNWKKQKELLLKTQFCFYKSMEIKRQSQKTIEYMDFIFSGNQNKWETKFDKGTICATYYLCQRFFA